MIEPINESQKDEKKDKKKRKGCIFSNKSTENYLFNVISYILCNKNEFEEPLKANDFDINLFTDSNMSKIDKLIYALKLNYFTFNPKRDKIKNLILYKELPAEIKINDEYYNNIYFKRINVDLFPSFHKNMLLDISCFPFYSYNTNKKTFQKYHMQPNNKKFTLCLYTSKCKNSDIDLLIKIVEGLKIIDNISDYFNDIYIIFQMKEKEEIADIQYDNLNKLIRNDNKKNDRIKIQFLFNFLSLYNSNDCINIFIEKNNFGEEYYFILNEENKIISIKTDIQSLIGRIVLFIINLKNIRKKEKEKYFDVFQKQKIEKNKDKNDGLIKILYFISKLKELDYIFELDFQISFNVCVNEELNSINIRAINEIIIRGKLQTKEFNNLQKLLNAIKTKKVTSNLIEINSLDIDIDFEDMKCFKCTKIIPEDKHLYYCYVCKTKYCYECVQEQQKKEGKGKFIDQKHNLIFFKTRNKERFKALNKYRFGNNRFTESTNNNQFSDSHSAICNGCRGNFDNMQRYVCIHCKPGVYLANYGGYIDYCQECITKMNTDENQKKVLEDKAIGKIRSQENNFTSGHIIEFHHNHDEHIYLFLPLEYTNIDERPYNNY